MADGMATPKVYVKKWGGQHVRVNRAFLEGFNLNPRLNSAANITAKALLERKGQLNNRDREILSVAPAPATIIHVELTEEAQAMINVHGCWQSLAELIPKINIHNINIDTQEERPQEEYSMARNRDYDRALRLGRKLLVSLTATMAFAVTGLEMGSEPFRWVTSALNKEFFNNSEMFLSMTSASNSNILLLIAAGFGVASAVYASMFGKVYRANTEAKAAYDLLAALNEAGPKSSEKA